MGGNMLFKNLNFILLLFIIIIPKSFAKCLPPVDTITFESEYSGSFLDQKLKNNIIDSYLFSCLKNQNLKFPQKINIIDLEDQCFFKYNNYKCSCYISFKKIKCSEYDCESLYKDGCKDLNKALDEIKNHLVTKEDEDVLEKNYKDIFELAESLLKKFPPDKYYFVGLGRTPSPINAYFQAKYGPIAQNIPLSLLRHFGMNKSTLKKLNNHFDNFLNVKEIGNKQIILFDYIDSGESLQIASQYFSQYLEKKGLKLHLSLGLMNNSENINSSQKLKFKYGENFSGTKYNLNENMSKLFYEETFKKFSEYSKYNPNLNISSKTIKKARNKKYDFMIEFFKKKLSLEGK